MTTDMDQVSIAAGPSSGRTSGRVKNKSQRALESEDTLKLLARARERARLAAEGGAPEPAASGGKKRIARRETKGKREERDSRCLCESPESSGPMIECGGCNDWYHFACIGLDQPTAERTHKYICPPCEESTGEKTRRLFDVSTFRSPSPPPGLIPAPPKIKKTIPRKRPLSKLAKPSSNDPTRRSSDIADGDGEGASESGSEDGSSSAADGTDSSASDSDSSVRSASRPRPMKKPRPSKASRTTVPGSQFYNKDQGPLQATPAARVPAKSRTSVGKPGPSASAKKGGNDVAPGGKKPTLPPARQHVLYKLTEVVRKFFGEGMKGDEAEEYAVELEAGLFAGFKEVVGGKETAGQRYKGQYSMLLSSLLPHLQESTKTAILSRELGPSQVASLSSADLASQARADEREKARRESLQQTVRQKDDFQGGVIMGREGMERVEQARAAERDQEESRRNAVRAQAREKEEAKERRDSMAEASIQALAQTQTQNHQLDSPGSGMNTSDSPVPIATMPNPTGPVAPIFGVRSGSESAPGSNTASPIVRRDSSKMPPSPAVPSPVKPAFSLTSAWGASSGGNADQEIIDFSTDTPDSIHVDLGVDQSTLDLSDFMQVDESVGMGDYHGAELVAEKEKELSPMEIYQKRPVIFSRGLINPNDRAAPTPHLQARALSTLPPNRHFFAEDEWRFILPGDTLEWAGRVPSAAGKSFLSQMRLSPKWDVFAMGLTMADGQAEGVETVYQGLLEDYVSRDRYAVCLPYGPTPPPRAAKDVYAIPLRPADKYPDFLDLLDGLTIPTVRDKPMWILVVVIAREELPTPSAPALTGIAPQYPPQTGPGFASQSPMAPPTSSSITSASELLKAQNLEALMRSIGTIPVAPFPAATPPHPQTGYSPATHVGAGGSTPYPPYQPLHSQPHITGPPGSMPGYPAWTAPAQSQGGGYDQYGGPSQGHGHSAPYPPQSASQAYGWNAPPGPPVYGGPGGGGAGGYGQYSQGPGPNQGGQRWDERRESGGRGSRGGAGSGDGRDKGRERERFKPVERDQGWGSRKRGGGGGSGRGGY